MAKYLSGRSKLTPQTRLKEERYKYLSVADAEPNLGEPLVGPSSIGAKPVPVGQQYIVVSVPDNPESFPGERYWIPNQGGIIPGSISVYDEGLDNLVGGLSSTTQLNFIGAAITTQGYLNPDFSPAPNVDITVFAHGNNTEVLFNSSNDFATDTRFTFNNGLLAAGDRITVGTGGTVITTTGIGSVGIGTTQPTQELHLVGDFRITGDIYDSTNQPGQTGYLLTKSADGVLWVREESIITGAGGTIGQIQFHNSAGLVDGADNFYYDFNNQRVGIGSTQPTQLLDVLGVSTFSGGVFIDTLNVSGTSAFGQLINANGGIDVLGHTETDTLNVSGLSTFAGNLDMNASVNISTNLDVDGTTDLDILNVSETAKFTDTADNTLGNTNTGSVQIDGGVGIDKNLTVGSGISATNLYISGIGTIEQFDFGIGEFDNIIVTGISTLGNVVVEGNTIKTKPGAGNLILDSDGASTIQVNDFLYVNKDTESTNKDNGSIYTEGGIGVEKSVNIGLNLNVTGDVGVGTDNPTRKLDVEIQTASFETGSVLDSHPIVEFINLSAGAPRGLEIGSPSDSIYSPVYLKVSGTSNRFAILDQHNDENFTILDNGNVGIGSTTPTEKLDVIGTAKVDGLKFGSGTAVTSVDTDLSSVSASDDTLASAKAIKSYVDAQATAQDLDFAGDTGSGSIDLDSETFTIVGTENEIQTVGSGNTLTIGLTETGVTADTYGSSTQVSQFTVDENGRITSASNVNINFSDANVATADSLTNSRNIAATGDIAWNVDFKGHEDVSGIATLSDTGVVAGTYGSSTQVGIVTVDSKGRITSASNVNINFSDANVATADSLTNSRDIEATGDISWVVNFKGHEDVSADATLSDTGVVAGTYGSSTQVGIVTVDSKGRITSASNVNIDFGNANVATADSLTNSRDIEATGDISWFVNFKGHENVSADATLASIITPGTVGSSTQVGVVTFDAKGRITSASNVNIDFGNANVATADSLTDSRNIAATGDIAWNVDFKGHENVSGIATLADTGVVAGTYGSSTQVGIVTVDSKGRITSASNVNIDFGNANVATADYADNAGIATNLKGGIASQIPYQTAANTTDFIPNGTSGQLLQSNGTSAPSWISVGDISAGTAQTANNLSGGAAGSIPYQDAPGSTVFLTEPNANGYILTYNNSSNAPQWQQLSSIDRTYTLDAVDSGDNVILRLSDGSTNDDVTITAGSNIQIDSVSSSGFTISAVAGAGLAPDSTISDLISISGGTISADDVGADRIFFWDDSQSKATHLSVGSGLQISGTTLSATSAGSVTDVTVSQVSYGGTNPITVTSPSAGTEQINIPDSSNAYGTRFIETYTPTTEGNNGDVWYQVSS